MTFRYAPTASQVVGTNTGGAGRAAMIPGGALDGVAALAAALTRVPQQQAMRAKMQRDDAYRQSMLDLRRSALQQQEGDRDERRKRWQSLDEARAKRDDTNAGVKGAATKLRAADIVTRLSDQARKGATSLSGHFDEAKYHQLLDASIKSLPPDVQQMLVDPSTGLPDTGEDEDDGTDDGDTGTTALGAALTPKPAAPAAPASLGAQASAAPAAPPAAPSPIDRAAQEPNGGAGSFAFEDPGSDDAPAAPGGRAVDDGALERALSTVRSRGPTPPDAMSGYGGTPAPRAAVDPDVADDQRLQQVDPDYARLRQNPRFNWRAAVRTARAQAQQPPAMAAADPDTP